MKRELKAVQNVITLSKLTFIAKLIPMKRELKVATSPVSLAYVIRDRKADPDEKGTESFSISFLNHLTASIAKLIPMKRELKDNSVLLLHAEAIASQS